MVGDRRPVPNAHGPTTTKSMMLVSFSRGSKALGTEAGGYASVAAVDVNSRRLTVEKANAERPTYDPRR